MNLITLFYPKPLKLFDCICYLRLFMLHLIYTSIILDSVHCHGFTCIMNMKHKIHQ
jgi:hypothetical protein